MNSLNPESPYPNALPNSGEVTSRDLGDAGLRSPERNREGLERVLEASPDLHFRMNFEGLFLDYLGEEASRTQLLYDPRDFIGKNAREVLPPYLAEILLGGLLQAKSTGIKNQVAYSSNLPELPEQFYEADIVPLDHEQAFVTCRNVTEAHQSQALQKLLMTAYQVLHASPDIEQNLVSVTECLVPVLGEICYVDLIDDQQRLLRVHTACRDVNRKAIMAEITARYLWRMNSSTSPAQALRTGETVFFTATDDRWNRQIAVDERHLVLLRELKLSSVVSTPLIARGQKIGVLTLTCFSPYRHFTRRETLIIEDLAQKIAHAIDYSRLLKGVYYLNQINHPLASIFSSEMFRNIEAIEGCVDFLLKIASNPGDHAGLVKKQAKNVQRSIEQIALLVQDLEDQTKSPEKNQKYKLDLSPFRLDQILHEILQNCGTRAQARMQTIQAVMENPDLSILCDQALFKKSLGELLNEISDQTPAGEKIILRVAETAQDIVFSILPSPQTLKTQTNLEHLIETHLGKLWQESEGNQRNGIYFSIPSFRPC